MLSSLQLKIIGGLVVIVLFMGLLLDRNHLRSEVAKQKTQLTAFQTTLNNVREAAEAAKAADAAHAKAIETNNAIVGKETSNDYETKLAAVRADYAERVRRATAETNSRSGGKSSVPSAATVAQGLSNSCPANELPPAAALTATEQALQLDSILQWGKKVGIITP